MSAVAIKSDTKSSVPAKTFTFGEPTRTPVDFFHKKGATSEEPASISVDFEEQKQKQKEVPAYYQKKQKANKKRAHKKPSELITSSTFSKVKKKK